MNEWMNEWLHFCLLFFNNGWAMSGFITIEFIAMIKTQENNLERNFH